MGLEGKDYLDRKEAAAYCCVGYSTFVRKEKSLGIEPFRFMGKLVYRKRELAAAMEREAALQKAGAA